MYWKPTLLGTLEIQNKITVPAARNGLFTLSHYSEVKRRRAIAAHPAVLQKLLMLTLSAQ